MQPKNLLIIHQTGEIILFKELASIRFWESETLFAEEGNPEVCLVWALGPRPQHKNVPKARAVFSHSLVG